jgi:organic hydroperoxide reductase OsmC/OhrA
MHPFPHHYAATVSATPAGAVDLASDGLPTLETAPPEEFGGEGDRWSPETLLVGAVADCFALTFRSVAKAAELPWSALRCEARGTLDRIERLARFTEVEIEATLTVPAGVEEERALRVLERAERLCLITNSLRAEARLLAHVEVEAAVEA